MLLNEQLLTLNTPILEAIKKNQCEVLTHIIHSNDYLDFGIESSIHIAILLKNYDALALILREGKHKDYLHIAYWLQDMNAFKMLFENLSNNSFEITGEDGSPLPLLSRLPFLFRSIRDDRLDALDTILQSNRQISESLILKACYFEADTNKHKVLLMLLNYCFEIIKPNLKKLCVQYPYTFCKALRGYNAHKKKVLKEAIENIDTNINGDGNVSKLIWNYSK